MAKMIPPYIRKTNSPGEPDIFVRLRDDPMTSDWITLHSLDVATHRSQLSGEVDFLVIIPNRGVLVVEVKACSSLRRETGLWYLGNSAGESRGPFRQASEAMHSLRRRLTKARPHLSRVPFWSCVIFPRITFSESSVEWHSWQIIDTKKLRGGSIGRLLADVLQNARALLAESPGAPWFQPSSKEPYSDQCTEIADFFRRDFEYFTTYSDIATSIASEIKTFTDEQLLALDAMEGNPRVVFKGPAGTGKSVLALEAARRAGATKKRVLFICYNKLLGQQIAKQCGQIAPNVQAKTLHAHMMDIAKIGSLKKQVDAKFWQSELPQIAIDNLLQQNAQQHLYDEIIVDEAQDLLRDTYFDFIDLSLLGGLSSGRWRLFGDFEKQAIFDSASLGLKGLYARLALDPTEYSLRINCRNTPSVASLAQLMGGLTPGYSRILRPHDGLEPQFHFYKNDIEQTYLLESTLQELLKLGLTGNDIVVLSPRADDVCAAATVASSPLKQRLRSYEAERSGDIRFCSIHSFKGLEAPAIVVTDLDNADRAYFESLIYIAVTRSSHRLTLLMHTSLKALLIPR
jgi:Nuclease-related domain/UvrD-like helicase C-terminal domain/Type III restriction enzyme, res subunit